MCPIERSNNVLSKGYLNIHQIQSYGLSDEKDKVSDLLSRYHENAEQSYLMQQIPQSTAQHGILLPERMLHRRNCKLTIDHEDRYQFYYSVQNRITTGKLYGLFAIRGATAGTNTSPSILYDAAAS